MKKTRQQKYMERMKKKGFIRVSYMIQKDRHDELTEQARKIRERK